LPSPAGRLRFDVKALHAALDAERTARGMSWTEVAAEIGIGRAEALTRLRDGGRVFFPQVMWMLRWLGAPAERYVRVDNP
jgi:hypothetical protein